MSGLIPEPYKKDGLDSDVYRIPVHFTPSGALCEWGGRDALPADLDRCPSHGTCTPLCEVNPDHLMARKPAVARISILGNRHAPACADCATGTIVSNRMIS